MHARTRQLLLGATTSCLLQACMIVQADEGAAPGNETILAAELSADLHFLAGDEMAGRLVGSPEIALAATFIEGRFRRLGLEPAGPGGSYYQRFDLHWFSLGRANTLSLRPGGSRAVLEAGEGWVPLDFSATAEASGEVVYAGFGIVEPALGHDDYRGEDVSGKVVLVLEREPGVDDPASAFDGVVTAEASRPWRKALVAQQRGAVGVLFVRDIHNRPDGRDYREVLGGSWPTERRRVERFTLRHWTEQIGIPAVQISAELAAGLVAGTGSSLEELASAAEAPGGHGVLPLPGVAVSVSTAVERHVTPARNVLAMMRGSDSEVADEVVIIGAHHDHNGADEEGAYNGADDDGSGIVGLLEVAEAYVVAAGEGRRPRRSIVFAAWDAEERGLLGAWYYTEAPTFPLERTVAVLNLDMIGRNEEVPTEGGNRFRGLEVQTAESNANAVNVLGYSRTPDLAHNVEDANSLFGLDLLMRYDNNTSNLLRRSDHWPFLQQGVPAVWFHTGLHPDYHTRNDDPDRIEYAKMERVARLVHQTSWIVANQDGRPSLVAPR